MKLLQIKKSPFEIEIQFDFLEFMPDADIDEASIIHNSFSLSAKHQFGYLSKFFYPESELKFSTHPTIKIKSHDNDCLGHILKIINSVNNKSDEIIKEIYGIRQNIASDNLQEIYDHYISNEISHDIRKSDLQFLDITLKDLSINVGFNLKELSHLNVIQSLEYINTTRDAIKEQFEIYNRSYCPKEIIDIQTLPILKIQCSKQETVNYLLTVLQRINNQSNHIYEQVLNDKKGNLKAEFSSFFNSYIAQEILSDYLPKNSIDKKKKNKV